MPQSKFLIGQQVKIISGMLSGLIGIITAIDYSSDKSHHVKLKTLTYAFKESDLMSHSSSTSSSLPTQVPSTRFKVGDRVKTVLPGTKRDGLYGTVERIRSKSTWPYKVQIEGQVTIYGFTEAQLELDTRAPVLPGKQRAKAPALVYGYGKAFNKAASMSNNSGHPWLWAHGWDSLSTATKSKEELPFSSSKCGCGSHITYGKNIPWDHHSDFCDIFTAGKENEAMMKALEKK